MKRRGIAVICCVLMFVCSSMVSAKTVKQGNCGNNGSNVKWNLSQKGVLSIYGSGKMNDYYSGSPITADTTTPWGKQELDGKVKKTIIKNGVTYIGNDSFTFCKGTVSVPASVKGIGSHVFGGSIKSIKVSSKNRKFKSKEGVLFTKNGTTLITYPPDKDGSTYTVPDTVKTIGVSAFYDCHNVKTLTLGKNVRKIEDNSFNFCNIKTIFIKSKKLVKVGTVEDGAFWTTQPEKIYVPKSKYKAYKKLFKKQLQMGNTSIIAF